MTPEELEAFYDKEIAPLLMEISNECEAKGMSLVCLVEWSPDGRGKTTTVREGASVPFLMAELMARPGMTIDDFVLAMSKFVQEHNLEHSSIILDRMGIAPKPEDRRG